MNVALYQQLFGAPYKRTKTIFTEAVVVAKAASNDKELCRALLNLAFAEIHMGSVVTAVSLAEQVIELAKINHLTEAQVEAQLWLDVAHHFSNNHNIVTQFEQTAVDLQTVGMNHLSPIAYAIRAREFKRMNDGEACANMIEVAQASLEQNPDPYVGSFVLRVCGMLQSSAHKMEDAVLMFERSKSIAEEAKLDSQLARTLTALGSSYVDELRPQEGLSELLRAQELYEKLEINDWYVAENMRNIAVLHNLAQEPEHGLNYAKRASELFVTVGDWQQSAVSDNILGSLLQNSGDIDSALAMYSASDAKFKRVAGHHEKAALPLANAANVNVDRGNFDEALVLLNEALATAQESQSAIGLSHVYASLGAFYDSELNHMYNPELAEQYLTQGYNIHLLSELGSPLIINQLAKYYEHHGNFQLALKYTKEEFEVRESARDANMQRQIVHLEAKQRIAEAQKVAEIEHLRNVELKAAQTLLVESERLASIGQLTAGIAHEINNPVTFITSSIGPLRRDLAEYETLRESGEPVSEVLEEIQQLLNAIESGAKRTAEIVQSLRTFSRLDEAELKQADIVGGIESTLTLLATRVRGQVEIVKQYDDIPLVECRPGQINQVVMNIISNALDAIENVTNPTIHISVRQLNSENIELKFQDNGPGIPEEVKSRLFEPFFTTKDVGKGTGLGLSISHGIIERHGGKISVSNQPGACFSVVIPITQPSHLND